MNYFLIKKIEDEFYEKMFVKEHKISANFVEKIERIPKASFKRNHLI